MRYRRPWLWLSPRTRRAVCAAEAAALQEAEHRAAVARILDAAPGAAQGRRPRSS